MIKSFISAFARRDSRYKDFEEFRNSSVDLFRNLLNKDQRAKFLEETHYFHTIKGGVLGGIDSRIFEVIFGTRRIDYIETMNINSSGFPQKQERILWEKGAVLRYFRTDAGTVIVSLFPAFTGDYKQIEDYVILEYVRNPKVLKSPRKIMKHWRAFMSYMECTSIDGEPDIFDKIIVYYLRATKQLVIDGKITRKKYIITIEKIAGYVATVGLSGFLLGAVEYFWHLA